MTPLLPARGRAGRQVGPGAVLALVGLALAPAASATERTRTVVEQRVAEMNPCAALTAEFGGQTVGLDTLDDVVVRSARATLDGDAVTFTLDGRLSCRIGTGALLQGDAASDVSVTAAVSLADCTQADISVSLGAFGGSFASILDALHPTIEARLAEAARPRIADACRDLRGE